MTPIHPPSPPAILMVSFDVGRCGPPRLPRALAKAGLRVHALCRRDDPLAATRFLERVFPLEAVTALHRFERTLADVMSASEPTLVVPCDERAVACLQALVRREGRGFLTLRQVRTLIDSLGCPDDFAAMLMKSETLALARRLGLATPDGATVDTVEAASEAGERFGWPVYLKQSFGWAGLGVVACADAGALATAMGRMKAERPSPARRLVRRLLDRDWYPVASPVDVQAAVDGSPAMVAAVAYRGRMLAAFAGSTVRTLSPNGPSSVVEIGAHPAMEEMSRRMIAALGMSGFVGFDFMIERTSGRPILLECNPRPIQIGHLGDRIGVDLAEALAGALTGRPARDIHAERTIDVALFPHGRAHASTTIPLDMPADDAGLLAALSRMG
jgi:glutathione synthase/RimK-type ligase-like ATP-grasp enzyme